MEIKEINEDGIDYIVTIFDNGNIVKEIKQEPRDEPIHETKKEPTELELLKNEVQSMKDNQVALLEGIANLYDEFATKNE